MIVKKIARADTPALLRRLVDDLRGAGYGAGALREHLGVAFPDDVGLLNHAAACERLRPASGPAVTAIRLCYLEESVSASRVRQIMPQARLAGLQRLGLLRVAPQGVRARLRIDAYGAALLLADRRFATVDRRALGLPPGDMVYPPGADSALLADAVPPREEERVLDLCTGTGIQAIGVSSRAKAVVAIDIGPRAAALARLNAAMNGADNVEVRAGDLFAPIGVERFDLVLANPPFVPAPARGPAYHSGGPRGDRVLRRIVSGLAGHLRAGGRALVISHLALRGSETVADALRPWLRAFPGRVLALVLETGTPVDLAAAQAVFALDDGFAAYAREIRRWLVYLARHHVAQVALLLLVAERGGPTGLEVIDAFQRTLPLPLSQPPRVLIERWLGSRTGG